MIDYPPKTPPAWFAQYVRRQEELQKELSTLKSSVGANEMAWGHNFGRLCEQVDLMFKYIKEKLP